jgi:hypothetical protein
VLSGYLQLRKGDEREEGRRRVKEVRKRLEGLRRKELWK